MAPMAPSKTPTTQNPQPKIMVFRPTAEEFENFPKYIEYMESKGAHKAGIAKVIPPASFVPRKAMYENIGEMKIPDPRVQSALKKKNGCFVVTRRKVPAEFKDLTVRRFRELAESSKYSPSKDLEGEALEWRYWKEVLYGSPIYGADVSATLTDVDINSWNINNLNTILDMMEEDSIEGVNTAYLYFGMWKTTFCWHTEDKELYSINYLHFGKPKTWYAVPPEHGRKFEKLAEDCGFRNDVDECPAFLRHRHCLIPPTILKNSGVYCDKITQMAGEFVVTFPYGYHCGFNHGYNCAESTNFAMPRWVEYGKWSVDCSCSKDVVKINMDPFVKTFQPDKYQMWKAGQDKGCHPEEPGKFRFAPGPADLLKKRKKESKMALNVAAAAKEPKKKRKNICGDATMKIVVDKSNEPSTIGAPSSNEPDLGSSLDGSDMASVSEMSEHELKIQRSLQNRNVPDWYKNYAPNGTGSAEELPDLSSSKSNALRSIQTAGGSSGSKSGIGAHGSGPSGRHSRVATTTEERTSLVCLSQRNAENDSESVKISSDEPPEEKPNQKEEDPPASTFKVKVIFNKIAFQLQISESMTVLQFKEKVKEHTKVDVNLLNVLFKGKVKNEAQLKDYGVTKNTTRLIVKVKKGLGRPKKRIPAPNLNLPPRQPKPSAHIPAPKSIPTIKKKIIRKKFGHGTRKKFFHAIRIVGEKESPKNIPQFLVEFMDKASFFMFYCEEKLRSANYDHLVDEWRIKNIHAMPHNIKDLRICRQSKYRKLMPRQRKLSHSD